MKKHNSRIVDNRATNFRMNGQIKKDRNASPAAVKWPQIGCSSIIFLIFAAILYFGIFG